MSEILVPATGVDDWRNLLADTEKHWKTGYSAKALAHCWQEAKGVPKSVSDVFAASGIPALASFDLLIALPEHKVSLPGGERKSQNDIWLLGGSDEGLVSVAVEGKVNEAFGPMLGEWLKDASDGKQERLAYLEDKLGLSDPIPDEMRYQLLHRAASAVIEAERFGAAHAMMLVHSFSQSDEWFNDYRRFVALFGAGAEPNAVVAAKRDAGIRLYFAWVRGEKRYLDV
jgi:hypothetical protein